MWLKKNKKSTFGIVLCKKGLEGLKVISGTFIVYLHELELIFLVYITFALNLTAFWTTSLSKTHYKVV